MDDFNGENNIWLFLISIFSFSAVGFAMYMQYFYDYQPCAWCVFQRLLFIIIGLFSLMGFILKINIFTPCGTFIFACIGQFTASYQHFVASKSFDCSLSFAEKIITGIKLDKILPGMFEIRALCADSISPLLGLGFDVWSFIAFFIICILSIIAYINRYKYY